VDNTNRIGYRRIAEILRTRINDGTFAVGALLPSIETLVTEQQVSRNVVRDALYLLRDEGVIDIVAGIGSTVLIRPDDLPPPERDQIIAEMGRLRKDVQQLRDELAELRHEVRQPRPPAPQPAGRVHGARTKSPRGQQPSTP